MKYVACFLVLCVVSVFSRVTITENDGVITNFIPAADLQKPAVVIEEILNATQVIIERKLSKHTEKTNEVVDETTTNATDLEKNETSTQVNKVDNGTALILTEYLKEGKVKEARLASKVDPSLFLGVKSYSGFFTVNETYNSNLFYWYFPVPDKPVNETPWIIWLQGGPGVSSTIGLFEEIGPFSVEDGILKANQNTWLQNHSLVFIDNPVGTGYSFTNSTEGFATDMATYAKHMFTLLKQFLEVYPELRTAPLYIAGESYAGKYVPALGMEIHKRWGQIKEKINFKGLMMGNAYMDPEMIAHIAMPFYYFGLLDRTQMDVVRPLSDAFSESIRANKSIEAKQQWNTIVTVLLMLSHQKHGYNFIQDDLFIAGYSSYLQTSEVKRALHVGDIKFSFFNATVNSYISPDFLSSTKPILEKMLETYRVLVYCGQLDQMLPCAFTSESYRSWKWSASEDFNKAFRIPYYFDRKLAGYHKSGGLLTEVVFRKAGHMAPKDTPAPVQNLITRWTHSLPLSRPNNPFETFLIQQLVQNNTLASVNYL